MNFAKKCVSLLCCTTLAFATACTDQSWALRSDYDSMSTGAYILFLQRAYNEAASRLSEDGASPEFMFEETIDEKKTADWIKDKALEYSRTMLAVEKYFRDLDLNLSDDDLASAQAATDSAWKQIGKRLESFGISKESYHQAASLLSAKQGKLFAFVYAPEGPMAFSNEQILDYYKQNFVKFSSFSKSTSMPPSHDQSSEDESSALDVVMDGDQSEPSPEDQKAADEKRAARKSAQESYEKSVKDQFESYVKQINDSHHSANDVAKAFQQTEKLESDQLMTRTLNTAKSDLPEELNIAIRDLPVNHAITILYQGSYYFIFRNPLEDTDFPDLSINAKRLELIQEIKSDEFTDKLKTIAGELNISVNQRALDKYSPTMLKN